MATIGSLNVNLGMNTADFAAGAKKAQKEVSDLTSGIGSSMLSGLVAGGVTAGITLGVQALQSFASGAVDAGSALASMVASTIEAIDSTGELASQLGVSVETLTGLQYAAKASGSDTEAISTVIEKLNDNLGNAKPGDAFSKSLEKIGLSANQLKQMDSADAVLLIGDRLSEVANQSDRTAIQFDLLGKKSGALTNLLNAGSDAVREQIAEGKRFGAVISDIDAATIAEAQSQFDRASAALQGVKNVLTAELAPYISVVTKLLVDFATEGSSTGQKVSEGFTWIAKAVAFVADMIQAETIKFQTAQYVVTEGLAIQARSWAQVGKAVAFVQRLQGKKVDTTFLEALSDELTNKSAELRKSLDEALAAPSWGQKVTTLVDELKAKYPAMAAEALQAASAHRTLGDSFDEAASKGEKLIEQWRTELATSDLEGKFKEIAKLKLSGEISDREAKVLTILAQQVQERERLKKATEDWAKAEEEAWKAAVDPLAKSDPALEKYWATLDKLNEAWTSKRIRNERLYWAKVEEAKATLASDRRDEDLKKDADKLKETLKTPLDAFNEQWLKLKEMVGKGLLTPDEAEQLNAKAGREFLKNTAGEASVVGKGNAALERGSSAAFSATLNQPADKMVQLGTLQLQVLQRIEKIERDAAKNKPETLSL